MEGKVILLLIFLTGIIAIDNSPNVDKAPFTSRRWSIREPYTPEHWKLVPRTRPYPDDMPGFPGLGPDDYFTFIPTWVGSAFGGAQLNWSSTCFQQISASLAVNGNTSAYLTITPSNPNNATCRELYLVGYVGAFEMIYLESAKPYVLFWDGYWPDEQLYDLQTKGLRFFRFPEGATGTATEVFETMMLFFGALIGAWVPPWTADDNIQFLADHMGVVMPVRSIERVDINKTEVKSGDFLGIIRLDGLDPMLAWAMGSHTGHTTICWWIDNELYVLESTISSNYWPTNGIQKTPWDTWINQAEKAGYNVVHLPLNPTIASKLDSNAAIAFYNSVQGLPYGFHNQFTGWIDTDEDNYPPPLHSEAVQLLASWAEWVMIPEGETYDYLRQTLNYRLGTTGLSINQAYMVAGKKGISFEQLVTMPEQDSWTFQDDGNQKGPSMVCDVFVMRMWKAAGVFGALTDQIQATEFTNWDAYSLNIFDANYKRPQQCVTADPDSQFCQLLGKYRMTLPDYNTVTPYAHMREKCPSLPPKYIKPVGC
jgi:hypothetical protein